MHIQLVSTDKSLYKLCRETLAGFRGNNWTLNQGEAPESSAPDLVIWDCDSDVPLPSELDFEQERKNLFLVSRKKMAVLLERLPMAAMAILLKPVHKGTLRAFLEHAVARHERNRSTDVDALRADRDEILQCLLHANLKLQEYDQDRTNFLARAVHDFRAPLTAVDGYCGLMLGEQLGPITEEQQEVIATIVQDFINRHADDDGARHPRSKGTDVPDAEELARDLDRLQARINGDEPDPTTRVYLKDQLGVLSGRIPWIPDQQQRAFLTEKLQHLWERIGKE